MIKAVIFDNDGVVVDSERYSREAFEKSLERYNIKLDKEDYKYIYPVSYLNKLPDFIIVHKEGRIDFLEVKFRHNALINNPKDKEIFEIFPNANMIVLNLEVYDKDEKMNTRFHVWIKDEGDLKSNKIVAIPLKVWLKDNFNIENNLLIKQYEELIFSWYKQNEAPSNILYNK